MYKIAATSPRQSPSTVSVQKSLSEAIFVFVHHDAVKKHLQALYDGAFKIIHRKSKIFLLDVTGKDDLILIDRLKKMPQFCSVTHARVF